MNVITAFVNAELEVEVYLEIPEGMYEGRDMVLVGSNTPKKNPNNSYSQLL